MPRSHFDVREEGAPFLKVSITLEVGEAWVAGWLEARPDPAGGLDVPQTDLGAGR